jgi:hypothetical protein
MSAAGRHQLRDRLGRFTSAAGAGRAALGSAATRALARRLTRAGRPLLAALRGELARRLYRLVVVAVALGAAVVLLYEHGDSPAALARTVQAAPSAGPPQAAQRPRALAGAAHGAGAGAGEGTNARDGAGSRGRAGPRAAGGSGDIGGPGAAAPAGQAQPAGVAAAWYAGRNHLKPGQVRPLQQDRLSNREVRVLVLADRGNGRLDTALVTVRRDAQGRWSVP